MRQSRRMSAVEALTSTAIGYGVAVATNAVVLPAFGFPVSMGESLAIGAIFTAVSIIRGYLVRRLFVALGSS